MKWPRHRALGAGGTRALRAAPRCLALALLVASGSARAQSASERAAMAQGLYESAVALIKAGRHAEACPKLEESLRLDPAMGTQFFLAVCYESTGRPTSAWSIFLEVAIAARAEGNAVRESTARARAAALEPRLPRLTVKVPEAVAALPGLAVERDGVPMSKPLWGTPVPVDLGEHRVRVTAPGKPPWEGSARVDALGQRVVVEVPDLESAAERPRAKAVTDPPGSAPGSKNAPAPSSAHRALAWATGGLALGGVAVGSALGAVALSTWKKADRACPTHTDCSREAYDLGGKTLSFATGSTVAFTAGGALLVTAIVLGATAPKRPAPSALITPLVSSGSTGLAAFWVF